MSQLVGLYHNWLSRRTLYWHTDQINTAANWFEWNDTLRPFRYFAPFAQGHILWPIWQRGKSPPRTWPCCGSSRRANLTTRTWCRSPTAPLSMSQTLRTSSPDLSREAITASLSPHRQQMALVRLLWLCASTLVRILIYILSSINPTESRPCSKLNQSIRGLGWF